MVFLKKYKIVYERSKCINAGPCYRAAPDFWKEVDNEVADLIGSKENEKGEFELIIEEKDLKRNLLAARTCPVNIIHIFDLETGEQLI